MDRRRWAVWGVLTAAGPEPATPGDATTKLPGLSGKVTAIDMTATWLDAQKRWGKPVLTVSGPVTPMSKLTKGGKRQACQISDRETRSEPLGDRSDESRNRHLIGLSRKYRHHRIIRKLSGSV